MSTVEAQLQAYLEENSGPFQEALCEWLRIPSVSTDSAFAADMVRGGEWLVDRLKGMGLTTELIPTDGHPIVYAESAPVENAPTVLVYGHYDVQPPDPLDEWVTPPFEPAIRDGKVFARGATDDKGQFLTHVLSCETWLNAIGHLPIQVKFLCEGEEECGSTALYEFLDGKYDSETGPTAAERLKADVVVISDSAQYGPGRPAITYGLRGLAYFELRLDGPSQDKHSGVFGGSISNPANVLNKMLASIIDDEGRIQIPGFYDDVIEVTERERQEFADLQFDEEAFQQRLGIQGLAGEAGYTTLERRWVRPTFDVNGLWSGYQGEGAKTVLPAKAGAKFSFRLVPNQDPKKIGVALEQMLQKQCPPGIRMQLIDMHGAPGFLIPLENPFVNAAAQAVKRGFAQQPVFIRSGGSIPIVGTFKKQLGLDTLLLGWGQDDDNLHSPNEKFELKDFQRGIAASAYLWDEIASVR